ncbi:MAG: CNNM domain-containing protein, partial [bacterium]
ILIGNMIVNVAATTLITAILLNIFGNAGVGIAIPLMSFLLLIAGEITPKSIAVEYNYTAVKLFALPIQLILTFLSPLIFLFTIFSKFISKKELARSLDRKLNEVDFKTAISLGFSGGFISLPMRKSLTRILEMDDIEAADVMAPRAEIPMIDKDFDKREIIEAFKGGAEFVFVYDGSLDNVVGIIPREKLPNIIESFDKNELIEPVLFCAFSTPIKDVISSFRAEGAAYACVVGEHGEILGGITLKNIVDFLFIQPFRTQTGEMEKLAGFVVIPATMTIYEFNGYFKSSLKSE